MKVSFVGTDIISKFAIGFSYFLNKQFSIFRPVVVRIGVLGHPISLSGSIDDFLMLKEIFVDNEYSTARPILILDIGSHIGMSCIWFATQYPNSQILAFEPDKRSYEKLKENTGHISALTAYNVAVSDEGKLVNFYQTTRHVSSSLIEPIDEYEKQRVKAISLDEIIGENIVDILKIDIEGAEFTVLHASKKLSQVLTIVGEIHPKSIEDANQLYQKLEETHVLVKKPIMKRIFIAHRKQSLRIE